MLWEIKGSVSSPSAFFFFFFKCLRIIPILSVYTAFVVPTIRAVGSVLEISIGVGVRAGVLSSGVLSLGLLSDSILLNRFQPFHKDKTQFLFLPPDPKQVHPFPVCIPYIMTVPYTFGNEPHVVRQFTFCKNLEHTNCGSLLTGGGEMEVSSFYHHCNSPWAFLSVLRGISVRLFSHIFPTLKLRNWSYHLTGELAISKVWWKNLSDDWEGRHRAALVTHSKTSCLWAVVLHPCWL